LPNRRVSVEIKPKAGYVAFSPLVHPMHRFKYSKSRFALLQKLHQRGHVSKGWTKSSESIRISDYDPVDLFSNDRSRMSVALSSLFSCPQNNLRIWYNDIPLVGHRLEYGESEPLCREMMECMFDMPNIESPAIMLESFFEDVLVSILSHETLLPKLLQLQELDILDADGAIPVFQRLVDLCDGSETKAESELDKFCLLNETRGDRGQVLKMSPFALIGDTSTMTLFCDEISKFRQLLALAAPALPPADLLDNYRSQFLRRVQSLSVAECQFLLSNWLFSLAMCDVSIFISLQQVEPASEILESTDTCSESNSQTKILRCVDGDPGQLSVSIGDKKAHFAYNVRLVDCDRKPASKLRDREEKELVFRKLQETQS
jgi:hypothetical protein